MFPHGLLSNLLEERYFLLSVGVELWKCVHPQDRLETAWTLFAVMRANICKLN
jgi:hypothetical protein